MRNEEHKTIEIPKSLYDRVSEKIKGTEFRSVSDYVTCSVKERLATEVKKETPTSAKNDEEKIKDRLRALGHL